MATVLTDTQHTGGSTCTGWHHYNTTTSGSCVRDTKCICTASLVISWWHIRHKSDSTTLNMLSLLPEARASAATTPSNSVVVRAAKPASPSVGCLPGYSATNACVAAAWAACRLRRTHSTPCGHARTAADQMPTNNQTHQQTSKRTSKQKH